MDSSNIPALVTAALTGLGGILTIILNHQQGKKESTASDDDLRYENRILRYGIGQLNKQIKRLGGEPDWALPPKKEPS